MATFQSRYPTRKTSLQLVDENISTKRKDMVRKEGGKRNPLGDISNNIAKQALDTRKDKLMRKKGASNSTLMNAHGAARRVLKPRATAGAISKESTLSRTRGRKQTAVASGISAKSNVEVKTQKTKDFDVPTSMPLNQIQHQMEPMVIDTELSFRDLNLEDIDCYDVDDPQCVTEYVNDVFEVLKKKEIKDRHSDYMAKQLDIHANMRAVLIDWMVDVNLKFRLLPESLFLAVNIIDRFLAVKAIPRKKLQLVGITSMLLATKYEEIFAPEINDFVWIADQAYTAAEIMQMEEMVLFDVNYNLTTPTPLHFLRRYSKAARSSSKTHTLSKYFIELSLLDYQFTVDYLPSKIAAASVYLAKKMTDANSEWTPTLCHYSGFKEDEIMDAVKDLYKIVKEAPEKTLHASTNKFRNEKLLGVSEIPEQIELNL